MSYPSANAPPPYGLFFCLFSLLITFSDTAQKYSAYPDINTQGLFFVMFFCLASKVITLFSFYLEIVSTPKCPITFLSLNFFICSSHTFIFDFLELYAYRSHLFKKTFLLRGFHSINFYLWVCHHFSEF